ncbi:MAG TPA: helix-turn-helix domain-containing protein [Candidatus Nanoarchaeia archaeon]|nr:helix-turn-helix domain-containing protein [Candidatus Nanoarchaeia archaeon]
MEVNALEQLGLTKNQSIVYISLLKLGSTSAQNIIKESGLHRSRVYDSLEKLEDLGLASFVVKDFKKYFQAAKPEMLLEYLDEKKELVNQILPELKILEGTKKEAINAFIYKGKEGIKTIHSEMLKEGKDVYVLGAKGKIFTELPYFIPNFERERIKKKIKFSLVYDKKEFKEFEKETAKRKMFEGRILPKGFESNAVVNVFGNKVAIVLWKEYPSAFMIENRDVAESFRKWFNFIYNNLK